MKHRVEYPIETGKKIWISASDVRKERTGTHAKIVIGIDSTYLAWTNFNVERDEDRTRLANSAHKGLGELDRAAWSAADMKHALGLFCAGLWRAHVAQYESTLVAGDPELGPPHMVSQDRIIEGGGTLTYAPPGIGKSYDLILQGVSIDAGCDTLWKVSQRPFMLINLERGATSIQRRITQVNKALGLDARRPLRVMNARGRSLSDIYDAAQRAVDEHNIGVVGLDSVSRAGFGDLTDNQPANKITDALNGLCPTWTAITHTPRADATHIYGSVHFEAGADIAVQLAAQTKEDNSETGIGAKVTKANDILKPPMSVYALEWGPDGLRAVRKAKLSEFPSLGAQNTTIEAMAREYLLDVGEATATEIATELGKHRSDVSRFLNRDKGFRHEKRGREVFWSVLEAHRAS